MYGKDNMGTKKGGSKFRKAYFYYCSPTKTSANFLSVSKLKNMSLLKGVLAGKVFKQCNFFC